MRDSVYSNAWEYCQNSKKGKHINILILNFSKVFDTMPEAQLLKQLESYPVTYIIGGKIEPWKSTHLQHVVLAIFIDVRTTGSTIMQIFADLERPHPML